MLPALRKEMDEQNPTMYCSECGEGIYVDDTYYEINNKVVCEDCVEHHKRICIFTAEEMEYQL